MLGLWASDCQHSSVARNSLCRLRPYRLPLTPNLACLLSLLSSGLVSHVVRLYGSSFWHYQQTQPHTELLDSLSFVISLSAILPQCSLALGTEAFVDVTIAGGLHNYVF